MLETSHITDPRRSLLSPQKISKRTRRRTDTDRLRQHKGKRVKYQERRATGRCSHGSCSEKAEGGHSQCPRHLKEMCARALERRNERIARGLCISCGERPPFWG